MIIQLLGNQAMPVNGVLMTSSTAVGGVVITLTPSTTENERVVLFGLEFSYATTPVGRITIADGVKPTWSLDVTAAGVHALGVCMPWTPKTPVTLTLLTSTTIIARLNARYALTRT